MKKAILACMAGGLLLSSCTGPFRLTQKAHKFQTSFDNKWADEVCFLGFVILPIYGACTLVDAVLLNSIEFWTGENPLAASVDKDSNKAAKVEQLADGSYRITRGEEVIIVKTVDNVTTVKNTDGKVIATSTKEGDKVVVRDASGKVTKTVDANKAH